MAQILTIKSKEIKIGLEGGNVITVSPSDLNYEGPSVGDEVEVFKDGRKYIVTQKTSVVDDFVKTKDGKTKVNKHLFVWVFSFLLGGFGVDRFIRGQIAAGVCKLLFSWVTLGIWPLVDWIIAIVKAYGSDNNSEFITFDKDGEYLA